MIIIASETIDTAVDFVPEGGVTMAVIALLVAIGFLIGLVFLTQVAKEWSR